MKMIREILGKITTVLAFAALAGVAGSTGGYYAAHRALTAATGEPAQAKVTFPAANQIEGQVPSVVRGRRINCIIFADVKRRISSVSC